MRPLVLACVAAILGAAPAHAAWSAPQLVTGAGAPDVAALSLTPGPGDQALLGWSAFGANRGTGRLATVAGDRPAAAITRLVPWDLAAPPARVEAGGTALLVRRPVRGGERLAVSRGTNEVEQILAMGTRILGADLAAGPRGDAVAAWVEDRGRSDRLWVATRRAGRAFGDPVALVTGGQLQGVSVAVGARGDAQVAFTRGRRVQARFRPAGRAFGPVADLGPNAGFAVFATAVTPAGRGHVAWMTQDGGEEAELPLRVYAATRGAGRYATQTLDPGAAVGRSPGTIDLALGAGARATVAWSRAVRSDARPHPIAVATTRADGRFGARREVPGTNGMLGAVAADGTLVWSTHSPGPLGGAANGISTARPPYRAAETVFDGPVSPEHLPTAAVVGGRTLVAWPGEGTIALSRRSG